MIETPVEKLQRAIFSADTEAGYKFRYHITRALAQESYGIEIAIRYPFLRYGNNPSDMLMRCFTFQETKEGHRYWYYIAYLLQKSAIS